MSRLVSRILLSILMFPLAGIFYILVFVLGENLRRNSSLYYGPPEAYLFATSGLLTWILVAVYWCLLWKSSVKWNPDRRAYTILAAVGALGLAMAAAIAAGSAMPSPDKGGFATFLGGLLAIVLWLIATVLIWRETPAERAQRLAASPANSVSCPTCGYNLTGLTESRCPECGSKFTLNELLASQPNQKSEID
jgi:uncharacterized paraquat-inducible protein A